MTLGQNIQNARRAQGLSQEALAEKIGVSRQALGKWEKDTALPGLDNLQALAAALGIGVDALLGTENADPAVPAVTLDALRDLLAARDAEEKRRRRLWGCAGGAVFIVLAGLLAGVALQYERQISALNQNYAAIQSSYAAQQAAKHHRASLAFPPYYAQFCCCNPGLQVCQARLLDFLHPACYNG